MEKAKRDLESEMKMSVQTKRKLEEELSQWKSQWERELEQSMKRLEEENLAKIELEDTCSQLSQEVSDLKRQLKLLQSEYKTKFANESEEKRNLTENYRKLQVNQSHHGCLHSC